MSKSTESIFDGKDVLIPLAEVSYILKFPSCIEVHFKCSAESVTLVQPDQNALISAWCRYRSEVEADTLMDLDGAQPAPSVPEGWKLVPIEPIQEMSEAGGYAGGVYYDVAEAIYEAMITVAPKLECE